jgi:hypothetical protein
VTNSSLLAALLGALNGLSLSSLTWPAHAEDGCTLRGDPILQRSVSLYEGRTGEKEIAHFTGARVALSISSFPDSSTGRAAVETSGFRISGFVRGMDVPVYTARSIPVYAGHVWIAEGQRVTIVGSGPGKLRAEKSLTSQISGNFRGWAPCDAFTLSERVSSGWSPPGDARGYLAAHDAISLYSAPRGEIVTSIPRGGGRSLLLWSTAREASWVHVEHHGEVVLDAWAKAEDLSPLPAGETMDQLAPSTTVAGTPRIQVQGQTKIVRVGRLTSIRAAASEASAVIGAIDPGVDVLVLDVVAGWASVLEKGLSVVPAGSDQFWVRGKELGL